MIKKTLYRYEREAGRITVSTEQPECEHTKLLRLIADDGKMLTRDDENYFVVIDVKTAKGWREVEEINEKEE